VLVNGLQDACKNPVIRLQGLYTWLSANYAGFGMRARLPNNIQKRLSETLTLRQKQEKRTACCLSATASRHDSQQSRKRKKKTPIL